MSLIYQPAGSSRSRAVSLGVVCAWMLLVGYLVLQHAFWRDEVRALSLALQGDSVFDMLRGMHGDGHPAVWHLLLRGAHALWPTPAVLPAVSLAVALAAALLLALRSPFGWPVVAALLLGRLGLYEYSVMARNYGISMLLMFLFAALYAGHRNRGIVLGVILLLLANCNVHSVVLAGSLALFWLVDILLDEHANRGAVLRNFAVNASIAAIGVLLCFLTVYPPFNDAAQDFVPAGDTASRLARSLLLPAASFWELVGNGLPPARRMWSLWPAYYPLISQVLMSVVCFGSALGLVRRPAAVLAAWVALLGLSVLFATLYPGSYRHQGLWLVFLVSLYWIVGRDAGAAAVTPVMVRLRSFGIACFALLLVLQVPVGLQQVGPIAGGSRPESRSRELAELIRAAPSLQEATILADPDYLVEPLPYYLPNRTWLPREQRFGRVVHFTSDARLSLSLRDILDDARRLRAETRQPVVILLHERLDPSSPVRLIREGYNWQLWTSPAQVREFLAATRLMARYEPSCCNDESYDVYVLE